MSGAKGKDLLFKPAFIRNEGQQPADVHFYTDAGSERLFLTAEGAVLTFGLPSETDPLAWAVALRPCGGAAAPRLRTESQAPGQVSFFKGNDPSRWIAGLDRWESVFYEAVWPGIDLAFQSGEQLKYEARVAPGADPSQISIVVDGVRSLRLDEGGNLILLAPEGDWELMDQKPVAWQVKGEERIPVEARFRLLDAFAFGFELPEGYDAALPLVIDPALRPRYSTYLGGTLLDLATAVDAAPDLTDVVAGTTNSADFPATPGVFQPVISAPLGLLFDAFVARFRPNGTLVFATFLGGTLVDQAFGVATDRQNNIYVVGLTTSLDFPVTPGAFDTTPPVLQDAFVTKLNPLGTMLLYSTFLGGILGVDVANEVVVDSQGRATVVGATTSSDFPTANAVQPAFGGGTDAFVTRFNAAGSALDFSTFLGGAGLDVAFGVDLDPLEGPVVVGSTTSAAFPTTPPFLPTLGGTQDGFVTRFTPAGNPLVYSRLLGGTLVDSAQAVAVDRSANAFVTGTTTSPDFPVTPGAFDTTLGGIDDAFVARIGPMGSIDAATYLGGSALVGGEIGNGIDLHPTGTPVIGGVTLSADFPTTPDAFQRSFGGGIVGPLLSDAFLTWMTFDLRALIYSTFLGGSGEDIGLDVAVHQNPDITIVGTTTSVNFPVVNAFDPTFNGLTDGFVTRFFVPFVGGPGPGGRGQPPLFVGGICPPGI